MIRTDVFSLAVLLLCSFIYGDSVDIAASSNISDTTQINPASKQDSGSLVRPNSQKCDSLAQPAKSMRRIEFSGMAALEEGQFVAGHHLQKEFEFRPWIHRQYGQLRLDAYIGERLHIIVNPQIKLWENTYPITDVPDRSSQPFRQYAQVTLENAEGILSIGNPDKPFMQIAAGSFTYKYHNNARNLGEYLFRTGTHPPYILNSFDYAHAILSGLRVSMLPIENLCCDILLTTETQIQPLFDWSLSLVGGYKIGRFAEIGAGASLDRFFPAQGDIITSPHNSSNAYLDKNGKLSYYGFGGTKLMGKIGFDLKSILPETHFMKDLFGKEGGKLYAEAAVLGVKNIPGYMRRINGIDTSFVIDTSTKNYYNSLKNRVPIMIGITIPTWRILDVLAIEAEYYSWPYTNSFYEQQFGYENPTPKPAQSYPPSEYRTDSWKWSVYVKKTIVQGFSIIAQFARDHTHHDIYNEAQRDEEEVFTRNKEWGWWLKCQYNF